MLPKTCLFLAPLGLGALLGRSIILRKQQFDRDQEVKRQTMRFRAEGIRELAQSHLAKLSGKVESMSAETDSEEMSNVESEQTLSPEKNPNEILDWSGLRFTVTGSLFQSLVSDKNQDNSIDVWPYSLEDERTLVQRLDRFKGVCYSSESESLHEYVIECEDGSMHRMDVFKHSKSETNGKNEGSKKSKDESVHSLDDVIHRFDIALTAVGAEIESGKVSDVRIHNRATESVLQRKPFLCEPLANPSFLLTTCERVLTIADQMGWPFPADQVTRLITVYTQKSPALRKRMYDNYLLTSVDETKRALVCQMFQVEHFST